jgi:5-methylcytosine-specific restriction endonuclease McrA
MKGEQVEPEVVTCPGCGCILTDENVYGSYFFGNYCDRCGKVEWERHLAELRETHAQQDRERRTEADRDGITCSTCGEHKPTTEFSNNKNNYTTYDTRCKMCVRASMKKYASTEKGQAKIKEGGARRRAYTEQQRGSASAAELRAVRKAQTDKHGRLRCWICGEPIDDVPHLDHFMPLRHGGAHDAGNLHYTHGHCNMSKGDKLPTEIGRLL